MTMSNRDWGQEAEYHLRYFAMCQDHSERVKYLASILRVAEAEGASRGGRDVGDAMTRIVRSVCNGELKDASK